MKLRYYIDSKKYPSVLVCVNISTRPISHIDRKAKIKKSGKSKIKPICKLITLGVCPYVLPDCSN